MSYRPTRRDKVLYYLGERMGKWVPGYELTTPEVGGSEGLRRLREARDNDNWLIEGRQMEGSDAWEYRMLKES